MKENRSMAENIVPCQSACPAHIDIPRYIRYIREGEFDKAAAVIREKVPFPETLGSICNHACEGECKRNELDAPLSVCRLNGLRLQMKAAHGKNACAGNRTQERRRLSWAPVRPV